MSGCLIGNIQWAYREYRLCSGSPQVTFKVLGKQIIGRTSTTLLQPLAGSTVYRSV